MTTTNQKIATAYATITQRGQRPTVRALREEAGVRTAEAAQWLRDHATTSETVPPAPDFSDSIAALTSTLWASAWNAATEEATTATADALDSARDAEADALERADAAESAQKEAEVERDRLSAEVDRLNGDLARLRDEAKAHRAEVETLHRDVRDAVARAAAAEATTTTLRDVLDQLRTHQTNA